MKYSQLHGKANDAYEEYSKDFVVDDYIAKAIGFTNGLNSTMFSTEDYARLRNIRLSHVYIFKFLAKEASYSNL